MALTAVTWLVDIIAASLENITPSHHRHSTDGGDRSNHEGHVTGLTAVTWLVDIIAASLHIMMRSRHRHSTDGGDRSNHESYVTGLTAITWLVDLAASQPLKHDAIAPPSQHRWRGQEQPREPCHGAHGHHMVVEHDLSNVLVRHLHSARQRVGEGRRTKRLRQLQYHWNSSSEEASLA
jgi:hypothetical protein